MFPIVVFLAACIISAATVEQVPGYTHRIGDCPDVDIKQIDGATVAKCAEECNKIYQCRAFMFYSPDRYCWLKSADCPTLSRNAEGTVNFYNKEKPDAEIPGVTDDPNRLVTIHDYQRGVSNPDTAGCVLPDVPGLGLIDNKRLKLGQSVHSQDCKTYTCLRVYETATFDVALISEYFGCWYKENCYLVGPEFRDDRCYRRTCEIVRSKADGVVRSNIKFVSTVADCPTADGGCARPGTKHFDCFLNGAFDSHCICKKKGSIVFLDSLMRFGKKLATAEGNAKGVHCFFPFKAHGQLHNDCILGDRDKKWCAVTDNYDRDGKWGYCIDTPRYRYTTDDRKCHLPFKYNGTLYHDCTKVGSKDGKPWCSTQFLFDPAKKAICDLSLRLRAGA